LIWNKEELPHQWKESIVAPIHKKVIKTSVVIVMAANKILSNILLSRLIPYTDENIGDHHCEFRRNMSMNVQIFYIRQILQKKWEYNGTAIYRFQEIL
jgi:hypothetical protein